jgi:hypothetical protein
MSKRRTDDPKLRQSISFTKEQHKAIAEIAEQYDVSFCWVVRYACDLMVKEKRTSKISLLGLSNDLHKE